MNQIVSTLRIIGRYEEYMKEGREGRDAICNSYIVPNLNPFLLLLIFQAWKLSEAYQKRFNRKD